MQIHISGDAQEDIDSIWVYSAQNWSHDQADAYLAALFDRFDLLCANPELGRERSGVSPPVRLLPYQSHNILYRVTENRLTILRVVHGRQNWAVLLKD